jgi:hypothetical protein
MQFNLQNALIGLSACGILGIGGYTIHLIPKGGAEVQSYKKLQLLFFNKNKPTEVLEGVNVRLSSAGPNLPDVSLSDGKLTFKVAAKSEKVEVFYEKEGFKPGRIEIDIDAQLNQTSNIPMEADVPMGAEKKTLK